jgi:diacylglycerol kinase
MKNSRLSYVKGFGFAVNGLVIALRSERNLRFHFWIMVPVCLFGLYLHLTAVEWMVITGCCALVVGAELMNTAIEKLTDLVSPEYNEKAGMVKDIAAAAVLICSIAAAIMGCLIFVPKLLV